MLITTGKEDEFVEIKNVENELRNRYPKMNQVSKKHLLNSIPRKWLKVGLSSLGLALIFKNNVFAISPMDIDIAGDISAPIYIPVPIRICNVACPIVQIVSAVLFIVTGLSILITRIKAKKQDEPKKVKKWIKVLFIISLIVFIISVLTKFVINFLNYY